MLSCFVLEWAWPVFIRGASAVPSAAVDQSAAALTDCFGDALVHKAGWLWNSSSNFDCAFLAAKCSHVASFGPHTHTVTVGHFYDMAADHCYTSPLRHTAFLWRGERLRHTLSLNHPRLHNVFFCSLSYDLWPGRVN